MTSSRWQHPDYITLLSKVLAGPWPSHWSSAFACNCEARRGPSTRIGTLQKPRLPVWFLGSTHAYGTKARLQTWTCLLLGWMMRQHAVLCKRVKIQLKWSNSNKLMFLHWLTRMLLYSVFCFKIMSYNISAVWTEKEDEIWFEGLLTILIVISIWWLKIFPL